MDVVKKPRAEEVAMGMTVLGLIFSSILYGITLTQTYKYFQRFPRDPLTIKLLVATVLVLDTASVFFISHACWYYLVTNGSPGVSVWSLNVELALSMVISGISESFLAYRVWKLSEKNYLLTFFLLLMATVHFVGGEVSSVQYFVLKQFKKFGRLEQVTGILRLGGAAICDTAVAISLCYFLEKKRTGFKRTDEIIDYMIIFAINSGAVMSVVSIACLLTYILIPKTWVYLALCFLISRLYSNTFLSCLNSRQILRTGDGSSPPVASHFYPRRLGSRREPQTEIEKTPTQIDVLVVTETVSDGHHIIDTLKSKSLRDHDKVSSSSISEQSQSDLQSSSTSSLPESESQLPSSNHISFMNI